MSWSRKKPSVVKLEDDETSVEKTFVVCLTLLLEGVLGLVENDVLSSRSLYQSGVYLTFRYLWEFIVLFKSYLQKYTLENFTNDEYTVSVYVKFFPSSRLGPNRVVSDVKTTPFPYTLLYHGEVEKETQKTVFPYNEWGHRFLRSQKTVSPNDSRNHQGGTPTMSIRERRKQRSVFSTKTVESIRLKSSTKKIYR